MNIKYAELINPYLEILDFEKALEIAETKLKECESTNFHEIISKSLLNNTNDLVNWIDYFYEAASKKCDVKSLYFEMNEFDINTDEWYIDAFAYDHDGGLCENEPMEWLCYCNTHSYKEKMSEYVIKDYLQIQKLFEFYENNQFNQEIITNNFKIARDWCEQIIIARFMELMRVAHTSAKKLNLKWGDIPIYFTEHSYDFVVRSENI